MTLPNIFKYVQSIRALSYQIMLMRDSYLAGYCLPNVHAQGCNQSAPQPPTQFFDASALALSAQIKNDPTLAKSPIVPLLNYYLNDLHQIWDWTIVSTSGPVSTATTLAFYKQSMVDIESMITLFEEFMLPTN